MKTAAVQACCSQDKLYINTYTCDCVYVLLNGSSLHAKHISSDSLTNEFIIADMLIYYMVCKGFSCGESSESDMTRHIIVIYVS